MLVWSPSSPSPLSNVLNDIREGSREMRTISEDCSSVASVGSWRMEMSPASQPHSGEGCGTVTLYWPDMCWGVGKSETMLDPGRGFALASGMLANVTREKAQNRHIFLFLSLFWGYHSKRCLGLFVA